MRAEMRQRAGELLRAEREAAMSPAPAPAPAPTASPVTACNECGERTPPDARFCSQCGARLDDRADGGERAG